MAVPTLTPSSATSSIALPVTGTYSNVNSTTYPLPFGVYTGVAGSQDSEFFVSGAVDQVAHVYKKLGGDVLDLELTEYQVYAAYEESVLEYSYIVNVHQAKNVLSDVLGNTTGTFNHDGQLKSGQSLSGSGVELRYPRYEFEYAKRVGDGVINETGIGGLETIYSASFDVVNSQQDYDLQSLIKTDAAASSSLLFSDSNLGSNAIGNKRITVRKVFYKTPHAMWRFYGYYGGLNTVGNLSNYGQFADDSTFEAIPVWQNKSQARAFEDSIYTRMSHFSYELKNNKLRLYPVPETHHGPKTFWVEFTVKVDAWEQESDREHGAKGINNMNTLPFNNVPYENINSIGKQWIRRFALALCKEMLGQIRSKFNSLPIPGESVTLNGPALITEGKAEQDALREELKTTLDELTYAKLVEKDAAIADSTGKTLASVPVPVFVG